MSLRLRLIVAFFLLSVVPLGAITFYMYRGNARATRDAASHEAELLAGELSQRMQVVTAELSRKVEQFMNLSMEAAAAQAATDAAPVAPVTAPAASSSAASPAPPKKTPEEQVTAVLGEMALLLNNVEVRGLRGGRGGRFGGGRGGPGGPQPTDPARGTPPDGRAGRQNPSGPTRGGRGGPLDGQVASPDADSPGGGRPSQAPTSADSSGGGRGPLPQDAGAGSEGRGNRGGGLNPNGRGGEGSGRGFGGRGRGEPPPETSDPTRISIDLAEIRRQVFDELVPDREQFDRLTPEERERVFAQINQRIQGIMQGIQMLRQEVAERAADAKAQEEAQAAAAKTGSATSPSATSSVPRPPAPPAPPAPGPPSAPAAPAAATAPTQTAGATRRTVLTGSRLDVRLERDGEIVSQVNAEVNFPNLLASVFAATRRDRGEVPFAVGKDGRLYTPTDQDKAQIESLQVDAVKPETPTGTSVLGDWIVVTTPDPSGSGLKFGVARPVGEALRDLQRRLARNAGLGLGLIFVALVGIVPISSRLTRNLSRLNEGVHRIAEGDYRARVEVGTNDEIGRLARAFNQMAADVESHQRAAVEQERLRRELELGRQIQQDILPQVPLRLGLTEVKGISVPAREVGGDFFNYFQTQSGQIALLVGDVSGKGVGAALLMMNLHASLRTRLSLGQDLAALADELDKEIDASTPGPVYATLFIGVFDPASRLLRYVNAGHNPQYVLRSRRGLEALHATGLPIGLLSGRGYVEQVVPLEAGDRLFFYTDGCVEAENERGDMFGVERLEGLLLASSTASADDALVEVEREITRFRNGRELSDDATIMLVNVG